MEDITKFLFEAGMLKLVPRSGWFKIGIKYPESVAEHTFRTALIAYIITYLETSDSSKASKAAFLALIHDFHESRTLDLHKLSRRYVSFNSEEVLKEQLELLPAHMRKEIEEMMDELGDFVKDADRLELLLQAKEYAEVYPSAMKYAEGLEFKSEAAKKLAESIKSSDHRWWLRFEE
ncbi:HD domain-containing protein [Archaeoglobus veneficus]|uniref:5'-deoxynucleotidase n=1 Tax=Archaeoglobus veneficus (strain DSM 11195 / SNP6) TaxID=693661 RepID=F2KRW7_ARCVS|nr:HD domain-containing protein [Archaeoglobus veneficus]AEA46808.1 metal dependent phosphohydrolase [Archaeoglobus veneficus SNP6]